METQTKFCPTCEQDLPVSEFGVNRSRIDQRSRYCKSCNRNKVTQGRIAAKEYKEARKKFTAVETQVSNSSLIKLAPVERVREAIRRGSQTQYEIARETKLGKDEIGDAIANLLLWTKEIETGIEGDERLYFIRQVEVEAEQPKRKDCVLSLSCFGPLMKHERVA